MTAPLSLAEVTALIDEQIKANTAGFVSLTELAALIDERIEMARHASARRLATQVAAIRLDTRAFEETYSERLRQANALTATHNFRSAASAGEQPTGTSTTQ